MPAHAPTLELTCWISEIRLRAGIRLGELIGQIDRAEAQGHGKYKLPGTGQTKAEALAEAGLNAGTAYALEALAGGDDPAARAQARDAAEGYFSRCRETRRPASQAALARAVRGEPEPARSRPGRRARAAVADPADAPAAAPVAAEPVTVAVAAPVPSTVMPPPAPTMQTVAVPPSPTVDPMVKMLAAVRLLARTRPETLRGFAVRAAECIDVAMLRSDAERAEQIISRWVTIMCVAAPRRTEAEAVAIFHPHGPAGTSHAAA